MGMLKWMQSFTGRLMNNLETPEKFYDEMLACSWDASPLRTSCFSLGSHNILLCDAGSIVERLSRTADFTTPST
jgi:hypothetical protein